MMNHPDYFPNYLTEPQVEAILHRGSPLLIIAGPGSGKTEIISWRVAHLVQAGYVQPEKLWWLVLTMYLVSGRLRAAGETAGYHLYQQGGLRA